MNKQNLFILFAKNPETEPVKTRLAKKIGDKARRVYENMLLQSIATHTGTPYEFKLYILGEKEYFINHLEEKKIEFQVGDNLGDRMFNALAKELKNYKKVIIAGSDIILSEKFVEDTFQFTDCVIGPAMDGGYYLIGLENLQNIFQDIPWSTSEVLKKTKQLIEKFKLDCQFLEEKRDLDDYEDYIYYKNSGLIKID
ncbi:MAG: glycosyltransferase [Desulfobacteraceae bacterium]|nr:glycosyltransferase [Desulfobacteraceae bacterium]